MATPRAWGPSKPKKPGTPGGAGLTAAEKFLKKKGMTAAQWHAKTAERWAAKNPPPLFPSTDITGKELRSLRQDAQGQVRQTYAAAPMPTLQTYLQPFADASTRNAALAQNYANYLQSSTREAQNLSGAFQGALTGGITAGQQQVASSGGSGMAGAIPPAAQSLIPAASIGSSFAQYLNAQAPYVGATAQETQRQTNAASAKAAADYQAAAATRRQDIQDAISKLYQSNVSTLQDQKNQGYKNAVTSYLALGKTAYQKAQLKQRQSQFDVSTGLKRDKLALDRDRLAETQSYHQASLDKKRTQAAAKGVDLSKIYKTLFVETPGKPSTPTGRTGPQGQAGREYSITRRVTNGGVEVGKTTTTKVAKYYGETIPKSGSSVDANGNTVTYTVTKGKLIMPPKSGSAASTRKATAQSWDRAWTQLQAAYPDRSRYTLAYLKSLMPKRPRA